MGNENIKEILDRLERIDHKEYSGGFEFADSASFNEMARCFEERKKMANYITNLQQENERVKLILLKAIEFIETNPLIWKPNMEITKLIENPDLKDRLFYTADEWLNKLHTILKGDDEK